MTRSTGGAVARAEEVSSNETSDFWLCFRYGNEAVNSQTSQQHIYAAALQKNGKLLIQYK